VNQQSEHLSNAQIEEYGSPASGAGAETEERVEQHLADCPSCRSRVLEFQQETESNQADQRLAITISALNQLARTLAGASVTLVPAELPAATMPPPTRRSAATATAHRRQRRRSATFDTFPAPGSIEFTIAPIRCPRPNLTGRNSLRIPSLTTVAPIIYLPDPALLTQKIFKHRTSCRR